MKVRIGYGLGTSTTLNDERFGDFCVGLERHGFDSLWVSERLTGPCPDPVVAMAYAAGATRKLKFGMSVMVLPGRNPVVTAKELASLDRMSGGRLLPAFGMGAADPREHAAFGVAPKERGPILDEAMPLMRRLWTEDDVRHEGPRFPLDGVTIDPKPVGRMESWLGGDGPKSLARVATLADGWLPSFTTPSIAAEGWAEIGRLTAEGGRSIDDDHFGVLIPYADGPIPDRLARLMHQRRPGVDLADLVPDSPEAAAELVRRFIDVGASKFVVVPLTDATDWDAELARVAEAVLPLQD